MRGFLRNRPYIFSMFVSYLPSSLCGIYTPRNLLTNAPGQMPVWELYNLTTTLDSTMAGLTGSGIGWSQGLRRRHHMAVNTQNNTLSPEVGIKIPLPCQESNPGRWVGRRHSAERATAADLPMFLMQWFYATLLNYTHHKKYGICRQESNACV